MPFVPGETGNIEGRPVGSRNRRTKEIINQIIAAGHKDPLLTLSELQNSCTDESIRATAANMLAPFLHSKLQSIPAPRYLDNPLEVPNFDAVADAEAFLARVTLLVARGELDFQSGLELSTLAKNWIDAKYARDELQLKINAQGGEREQVIRIEGGLPQLPGTNVIMPPKINGHELQELPAPDPDSGAPNGAPDPPPIESITIQPAEPEPG